VGDPHRPYKETGGIPPGCVERRGRRLAVGAVVVRQAGPALGFSGDSIFTGRLENIPLPKSQRSVDRWLNIDAGFNRNSNEQLGLGSQIRYSPLRYSGIRGDGQASWDFSILKNFPIREKIVFQFRAEVYNAWNHANLASPVTSPTATTFGRITSTTGTRVTGSSPAK